MICGAWAFLLLWFSTLFASFSFSVAEERFFFVPRKVRFLAMTMSEQARRCSFCSTKKFSFKFYCVVLNEVTRTFKAPRCRCFLPQSLYFSLIHGFFVEAFLSLLFGLFFRKQCSCLHLVWRFAIEKFPCSPTITYLCSWF